MIPNFDAVIERKGKFQSKESVSNEKKGSHREGVSNNKP